MLFTKRTIAILLICFLVGVAVLMVFLKYDLHQEKESNALGGEKEISREEIIEILKKNEDASNYLEKYRNFRIEEKTLLTGQNILEGRDGEEFREIYDGLEIEDERYLKIILIDQSGTRGLIAVLDIKNKEAPNAYGLILLQGEVQE